MNVRIKSFDVDVPIKQNGIEIEVRTPDGSKQVGDCYVTMTKFTLRRGKTTKKNGVSVTWDEFADILASAEAKKAALRAARATD